MIPQTNPKDSMKSTWRHADRTQWTVYHWIYERLNIYHVSLNQKVPVHDKGDRVPYMPDWRLHAWVLSRALMPIALHQLYVYLINRNLHPIGAYLLYSTVFKMNGIREVRMLRDLGHRYGFLDGDKHERDSVPDVGVSKVLWSLIYTANFRSMMVVMLGYSRNQTPASMSWVSLVLELAIYGIILDFWFYWYHRLMHQVDSLWKYHRTHHLTKHPNPLLTLYADTEQEFFDIIGIPLLTYFTIKLMGLPMGFYDWWICQQYVVFTELFGHSGVRVYATPPSPVSWLLQLFDADLQIEDHDLHHRKGWKKSYNYGKQTRVWDRIFNTCTDRIEARKDNIDYEHPATMPLF
ncbi:MAG: hypothetical protein M1820_003905 [Bogoriella megaspora]|nr:MAG: hypothetical protein M1820_003905 [Bogoriella megaspora]